jgi:hypothetical protein
MFRSLAPQRRAPQTQHRTSVAMIDSHAPQLLSGSSSNDLVSFGLPRKAAEELADAIDRIADMEKWLEVQVRRTTPRVIETRARRLIVPCFKVVFMGSPFSDCVGAALSHARAHSLDQVCPTRIVDVHSAADSLHPTSL